MVSTLQDTSDILDSPVALQERLRAEGYLFLRGLLPAQAVLDLRAAIVAHLAGEECIAADGEHAGAARYVDGEEAYFRVYEQIQRTVAFHQLAWRPELLAITRALLDDDVLVHPRKIARVTFPGNRFPTPAHQDYPFIQGAVDGLTTWIPLGECTDEMGSLRVLPGSHHNGIRPVVARHGVGGLGADVDESAHEWLLTDYRPGDVLLFHSLTVHWAPPNESDKLRLSVDYRYQAQNDPITAHSLQTHGHPILPAWEEISAGWPAEALRYIRPPQVESFAEELAPDQAVAPPSRYAGTAPAR